MGAAHLGYDAVSKGNGKVGRMVADRKGIGTDDSAGDGGQVVLEEGLGRCAAEAVLGGIVPLRVRGGLGQHVEEMDHPRREGTGVL